MTGKQPARIQFQERVGKLEGKRNNVRSRPVGRDPFVHIDLDATS